MSVSSKLNNLLKQAEKLAEKEVIRLAKRHLKSHPNLKYFLIAMGTYYFVNNKDDIDYNAKCKSLDNFISKWDEELHITGNPMTFTATSKITRDW
jgi:hypothetical protein